METQANEVDFDKILRYEHGRYKKKGYGIIFAVIITLLYMYAVPNLAKYVYPTKRTMSDGAIYFFFVLITHEGIYILINLVFLVIYKLKSPFFERYKTTGEPWPWDEDSTAWYEILKQTLKLTAFNHFIILPLSLVNALIYDFCPYELSYDSLPDSFTMLVHFIFFMLIEDCLFYWGHRLLHSKYLYAKIHKIHHTYKKVVSISFEYAHPIEYFFVNVIPSALGPLILGKKTHFITYLAWLIVRIGESADGHCGYEFSWSPYRLLFLSAGQDYHNFHHLFFKDNYGSFFTIWDRLCGTVSLKYKDYVQHSKIKSS